ncbi:MAG TPA: DUF2851 family protein [Chryseosolibacter sp.]
MNEAFLHYIWQYQYFDKVDLCTTAGDPISIIQPGFRNTNAGPDFLNAKIKVGDVVWIGHVEIHINSSEWIDHKHHVDPSYENVILHVVWKENQSIRQKDNSALPTAELKGRVSDDLILRYRKLINQPEAIPCSHHLAGVRDIVKYGMIEKALIERLENKAEVVHELLKKTANDWEQTTFTLLCKNFGFKINTPAFERLAEVVPHKLLLKHQQLMQVEALLFGQAGFLDETKRDTYYLLLKREYDLLGKKYGLDQRRMNKSQWKFLRLRPANFPTLRIAQLAALVVAQKNMFSKIVDATSYKDLLEMFSVSQSDYWQTHYRFDYQSDERIAGLGDASINNLLINTAIPLMVAYGKVKDDQMYVDKAVALLQQIPTEENAITKRWKSQQMVASSAADSQGFIELFNNYCVKRRCLDCNIGFSILLSGKT